MPSLRFARGYDRWMDKRDPVSTAMRFAMSMPGQILVNTAAFTLPDELRMPANLRVLDVGCGRGGVARVVAQRAQLQEPPVGIDASRRMLELGRRDTAGDDAPLGLAQGAATSLPLAGERFDLAICAHAFKYLTDEELDACLADVRRVLKPGGLFVAWEFSPTRSALLDRWNRWVLGHEVPFVRLRGYRELRQRAYDCGFDYVERAQLRPFLLPPIPRVSLIMGRLPEGWRRTIIDGRATLVHEDEEAAPSGD